MSHTWSSQKYGTRWGLAFFHYSIFLLGRRFAYFFLYFVVFVYVAFFPSVRRICRPYLSRRFPGTGRPMFFFKSFVLVLNLGKILIDSAVLESPGAGKIKADFHDPADYHKIKNLNSGFIILMSHVGCWQVAMTALSRLNRPVNLLMLELPEKIIGTQARDNLAQRFKVINPAQFLGGTLDMLNVLKNDEILCIMGDRLFGNAAYALEMTFLGDRAAIPFSAYKLSAITQKPIVVLNTFKTGHSTYELSLPRIIHVPPRPGKTGRAYEPYAREYIETLEQYTKNHPYQFFNFYDMWDPKPIEPSDGNPARPAPA
ncbi:lysophospholipid acyltransferase family protein [uncultured Desulfobacter sp.]|uniref:lysophospholipid acyltransferase family protein n=1 Tax=uncultured Desulfobacter sp. TaxID=240139 RepID=UPI002AAC0669|nr:lysophospholipid acyltransferase family protein [uncultured Desulfobacter sp.]